MRVFNNNASSSVTLILWLEWRGDSKRFFANPLLHAINK